MRKKWILAGVLILSLFRVRAQQHDSSGRFKISKSEIELVYSHYIQDGNNSAVTGGIGTEKLTVYAPSVKWKQQRNRHSLNMVLGTDIITSASTDNIDYAVSSASRKDARTYANLGYTVDSKNNKQNVHLSGGFSIESDYLSLPIGIGAMHQSKNEMRTWFADILYFTDDLRWGRLNREVARPVKLIYPEELRYRDWHDGYKRRTTDIRMGLQQILNKRNVLGIYPEWIVQKGLLSTPFHRVYFLDQSLRVEQLPDLRFKQVLGIRLHSFVGGRAVLKSRLDLYNDNFGVQGLAIEEETVIKFTPSFALSPAFRWSVQKGSKYFKPFGETHPDAAFYTSDYDLSNFQTFQFGLGMRYKPGSKLGKNRVFNEAHLQYLFYTRSNGLHAHMLSLSLKTSKHKKKKRNQK